MFVQVDLLSAVEPGCIDLGVVTPGISPRDRELNAKYAISTARKLGCSIFLLWCALACQMLHTRLPLHLSYFDFKNLQVKLGLEIVP